MQFGAAMFFTDASMTPGELGPLLEERGFELVWVPEHSHIPVVRTMPFPGGPELPRPYYDIMDPFLVLTAAAVATKTLEGRHRRLPDQSARSDPDSEDGCLDRPAVPRAVPVRCRQRLGQGGDGTPRHGVRHAPQAVARARRGDEADLDRGDRRVPRRVCQLRADADLAEAGAEATRPVIVGGAFPYGARRAVRYGDGWIPGAGRTRHGDIGDYVAAVPPDGMEAGRDPAVTAGHAVPGDGRRRTPAPVPRSRRGARGDQPACRRSRTRYCRSWTAGLR